MKKFLLASAMLAALVLPAAAQSGNATSNAFQDVCTPKEQQALMAFDGGYKTPAIIKDATACREKQQHAVAGAPPGTKPAVPVTTDVTTPKAVEIPVTRCNGFGECYPQGTYCKTPDGGETLCANRPMGSAQEAKEQREAGERIAEKTKQKAEARAEAQRTEDEAELQNVHSTPQFKVEVFPDTRQTLQVSPEYSESDPNYPASAPKYHPAENQTIGHAADVRITNIGDIVRIYKITLNGRPECGAIAGWVVKTGDVISLSPLCAATVSVQVQTNRGTVEYKVQ